MHCSTTRSRHVSVRSASTPLNLGGVEHKLSDDDLTYADVFFHTVLLAPTSEQD